MSHEVTPAEWLDLATARLDAARRALRAGESARACDEIRLARRCAGRCLVATAGSMRVEKDWSTR